MLLIIDPDPKDTNADNGKVVDVVEATRDIDYTASPASSNDSGRRSVGDDDDHHHPVLTTGAEEGEEKIRVTVPYANRQVTAQYADGEAVNLTVGTADVTLRDGSEGTRAFPLLRALRLPPRPTLVGHGDYQILSCRRLPAMAT